MCACGPVHELYFVLSPAVSCHESYVLLSESYSPTTDLSSMQYFYTLQFDENHDIICGDQETYIPSLYLSEQCSVTPFTRTYYTSYQYHTLQSPATPLSSRSVWFCLLHFSR